MTQTRAVGSPTVASPVGASDMYVPSGRIGKLDLRRGCYTAYEVVQLAAREVVESGDEIPVRVLLKNGVNTVREFLGWRYGCVLGRREYWHARRFTPDEADCRDFLRILRRAGARRRVA